MTKTFSAIFENGVFRPVEPVDFPEHCQVQVEVRAVEPPSGGASSDAACSTPPRPQRVRLVGKLARVHTDTRAFDLVLDDGHQIAGKLPADDPSGAAGLIDRRVLVLGTATYGTSGNLLHLDADEIGVASDEGACFSAVPQPVSPSFDLDDVLREQRHKRGLSAIIGQWPGDESDEEVAAALRELS